MTAVRKSHRICPCNAYDIEGIQSWLEDLAAEGLQLEKDGYFAGFFTFTRTEPKRMTYRLVPVKKDKAALLDENDPDSDEVDVSASMGWTYLVRYGMFHIYVSQAPSPRELHTDPAVQSLALNFLRKRLVSNIVTTFIWAAIYLALRQSSFGYPFRNAATIGLLFSVCIYSWLLVGLFTPVADVIRLLRYQKRLRSGDSLTQRKNWRKSAHYTISAKLLVFLLPILGIIGAAATQKEAALQPILPDTSVPFVTIRDLIPDGEYIRDDSMFGDYNEYRSWSTAVAPVNMEWNEWATVTGPDGAACKGILRIDYHECSSEWLAQQLANDYYQYDRLRYTKFEDLPAPDIRVDSIRHYYNYLPCILIQHDNIVIHVTTTLQDENDESAWGIWLDATEKRLNN